MRKIDTIVVHHSATPRSHTLEQITEFHRTTRGWSDVGYHALILGDGRVVAGRDLQVSGAHAKGHNLTSIGVCVVGDNTQPEDAWTETQKVSLRAVVDSLLMAFPGSKVCGHRDLEGSATLCPGVDVQEVLYREA